jgi:TM2 domain-containing membrane protein YozV
MVAALLSFFVPGVGQMAQGRIGVGVCFLLAYFVSLVLTFLILIGIVPLAIVWLWAIIDAANN